jgi:hypothetical protein
MSHGVMIVALVVMECIRNGTLCLVTTAQLDNIQLAPLTRIALRVHMVILLQALSLPHHLHVALVVRLDKELMEHHVLIVLLDSIQVTRAWVARRVQLDNIRIEQEQLIAIIVQLDSIL